ncbi:NB-ARC - like 10 [Theobroma cacao]|nr:NB-ARC - like 10 [Theobroma cacao]
MAAFHDQAMLSALFNSLQVQMLNFARREQTCSPFEKWVKPMNDIDTAIADAEEKQKTLLPVEHWLTDLRNLAYDAEACIDEFATEALGNKIMAESDSSAGISKVLLNFILTCFSGFNANTDSDFRRKIESKIEEITVRLQGLVEKKKDLKLGPNCGRRRERVVQQRLPTTSLVNESHIYGREKDKEAVIRLLKSTGEVGIGNIGVVPIVGMGGLGKTTLAQLVYNDARVGSWFQVRIWVNVSAEFDMVKVTKTVLQAITQENCNWKDLNLLQVSLKEKLSGKKFLIVLDEVWNENNEQWDILCRPFQAGAIGSKILVTTRSEGVASIMTTCGSYQLQLLSNDGSFSLFTWHALGLRGFDGYPNLKVIAEEIVRKCNGLPLTAKTLGGLLRNKLNQDEWETIMNSRIWDLPEEVSANETQFVMHDLINDLAQSVSGDLCFNIEDRFQDGKFCGSIQKMRHFSFTCHHCDVSKRFSGLCRQEKLRTFIALPTYTVPRVTCCYVSDPVMQDLLTSLRHLRVLRLCGYCIDKLPESVGHLKHLRRINCLPESVGFLFNLQTLILQGCKELTKLPQGIVNLINLHVLDLSGTENLQEMPQWIGLVTTARGAFSYGVGKCGGCSRYYGSQKHMPCLDFLAPRSQRHRGVQRRTHVSKSD